MIFKYGKNYSYIFYTFFIFLISFIALEFIALEFGGFTPNITRYLMTLMLLFLLISQLRSGVALNPFNESWTAKYKKGTLAYKLCIGGNLLILLFSVLVLFLPQPTPEETHQNLKTFICQLFHIFCQN